MADLRNQCRIPIDPRPTYQSAMDSSHASSICLHCKAAKYAARFVSSVLTELRTGDQPWPRSGLELSCLFKVHNDSRLLRRIAWSGYVSEKRINERYHSKAYVELNIVREIPLPWNPNTTAEVQRQIRWGNEIIEWYEERWPRWRRVELPELHEMWKRAGCPYPLREHHREISERDAQRTAEQNYWKHKWKIEYPRPALCQSIRHETDLRFGSEEVAFGANFSWLPRGSYRAVNKPELPGYVHYKSARTNRRRLRKFRRREKERAHRLTTSRNVNWERELNLYERQGFLVQPKRIRKPKPEVIRSHPLHVGKRFTCISDNPPQNGDMTKVEEYWDPYYERNRIGAVVDWHVYRQRVIPRETEMVPIMPGARWIEYSLSDKITAPVRQIHEFVYSFIGSVIGFTPDTENEVAKEQTLEDLSEDQRITCDPDDPDIYMD